MANEIMMTPEELRQKAGEIRQYKESHVDVMNRMTNLVSSMYTVWRGEAQDAFVSKYFGMKNTYTNFQSMLENFAALAEEAANTLETADQSVAGSISGI